MLKKGLGTKGVSLLAGLVMVTVLSGCGKDLAGQDSTGAVLYEEEQSGNQAEEHSEETITDDTSNNTETAAPVKEEKTDPVKSETEEPAVQSETSSQPQAEASVTLTDQGKEFLAHICRESDDFDSEQAMDESFWRDFLFASYTGVSWESAVTEQVYREDLGFEETVVKVSLQEAQERVKLVFGVDLPDLKPSFEDMEEGQTSFYYKDGYYYIGVSDLPDYQYTFSKCAQDKENSTNTIVKYTIDFMGESNVGTVTLGISPENNENGFVIRSKTTEFYK